MITGFPPAPLVGALSGVQIATTPSITLALSANSAVLTPSNDGTILGDPVTIPAATDVVAGLLDAPRATIIDALPVTPLSLVAATGLYTDLIGEPSTFFGSGYIIDGGGIPITTGVKGFLIFTYSATITQWAIIADASGAISVDIWKANGSVPVLANSITGGNPPLLSATQYSGLVTPVNWSTVSIIPGDVMGFNVSSTGGVIQRVTIALQITHL